MYTNLDDYPELFRMQDMVILPVRHVLTNEELLERGCQIAALNADIEHEESAKKQMAAEYKNKIDSLKAETKLYSGQVNNGFIMVDTPTEMFLDYEKKKRVFFNKQNGDFVKAEDFHASDFTKRQTALDLEAKLTQEDIERQKQIEANNQAGEYADGDPFAPVDDVIVDRKLGIVRDEEVTANDHDGTFRDQHGNIVTEFGDDLPI